MILKRIKLYPRGTLSPGRPIFHGRLGDYAVYLFAKEEKRSWVARIYYPDNRSEEFYGVTKTKVMRQATAAIEAEIRKVYFR